MLEQKWKGKRKGWESGRGKTRGGERQNPRWRGWLREQGSGIKVQARFEWPPDEEEAFFCFVLQPLLASTF